MLVAWSKPTGASTKLGCLKPVSREIEDMRKTFLISVLVLGVASGSFATLTFQQLDDNTFSISHKVKWIGGRGQALDLVYEKAASLCVAAGYTHFELVGQASNAAGFFQDANATLTVAFFQRDGKDRIECEMKATDKYVAQASKKLDKRGYKGPTKVADSDETHAGENQCSVEQITAMVQAGLSGEQIEAACNKEK